LLSGRSQKRLVELHRAVNSSIQSLNHHHSLVLGALLSCDASTQKQMLDDHRALAADAVEAVVKLSTFLDHCRIAPESVENF